MANAEAVAEVIVDVSSRRVGPACDDGQDMTTTTGEPDTPKRSVGRPRTYDEVTEREIIFKAADRALRDNRDQSLTIADILTAAGVSTRSFYRHFGSKDELLCAMYLRDGERASARLTERLAGAANPREALAFWIDELFSFHIGPRAERMSVMSSVLAIRAEGSEEVHQLARALLLAPLLDVVRAGNADGTFASDHPESDTDFVAAAVFHASGLAGPNIGQRPAAGAAASVLDFCLRALGATR